MAIKTNGETVRLADSAREREDSFQEWEIEGFDGAAFVLRRKSETPPAGVFRVAVLGDYVVVQRAAAADESSWTEMARFAASNLAVSRRGTVALMVVRFEAAVEDEETVELGDDLYEFFTEDVEALANAGAIGVDVSGGSTVKSAGTLHVEDLPTAGDTITIGSKVYTLVDDADFDEDGEISLGETPTLAECQANIVAAINGTDGVNDPHPLVTAAAFANDDCVITAIAGGTAGDVIATTETFTSSNNVFDANNLGTTAAGVDPTAEEALDALLATINASATEAVRAIKISASELLVVRDAAGVNTDDAAEDMAGTDNEVAADAFYGGAAAAVGAMAVAAREPNATEVALGNMHFALDFDPVFVQVLVTVTATGLQKAWDGAVTITPADGDDPAFVTVDNSGSTDWADTDTVRIMAAG